MTRKGQPPAIRGAVGRRFIEQNERLQDGVNFNHSAAVELAQRGSVLDRPGIRNPGWEDYPLFRDGQFRIVRDVSRMSVDRRLISWSRGPGDPGCFDWKRLYLLISVLRRSGLPARDREAGTALSRDLLGVHVDLLWRIVQLRNLRGVAAADLDASRLQLLRHLAHKVNRK